jgi:hypothetical protein
MESNKWAPNLLTRVVVNNKNNDIFCGIYFNTCCYMIDLLSFDT